MVSTTAASHRGHGPSTPELARRLWSHAPAKRRRQFGLLLLLMLFASLAEIVSIGSVLPFLTALTQPRAILASDVARPLLNALGVTSETQLIASITALFVTATILACGVRVGLLWCSTRFAFAFGSDLSHRVYWTTLHQPYAKHTSRNSSEVVNAIWVKVSEVIFYVLLPGMSLIISSVVAVAIAAALLWAVPGTALAALAVLLMVYAAIMSVSRRRLKINSVRIAQGSTSVVKTLQEGLGGIRDILMDGSQIHFCSTYRDVNHALRKAQGENQIISQGPRYLLEAMGMLLIATLAYLLTMRSSGIAAAIPLLGAIALGLQRLLPAAQLIFGSWSTIHGAQASLSDVLEMLDQPVAEDTMSDRAEELLPFHSEIRFHKVSFRHRPDGPLLFDDIDLTIRKGARVGFIGSTGSGKSTLLDIAMGLLDPINGRVEVDGVAIDACNRRAWQRRIAHVPQTVFLADASLEENVAFGSPAHLVDPKRVRQAVQQAQLAELVESWPRGYRTPVGERGVQLSGGQRQRIGIARALYKNADVIILDEATSALDTDTEQSVMSAIASLSQHVTLLIIAHRLNTLAGCSDIVDVGQGRATIRQSAQQLAGAAST